MSKLDDALKRFEQVATLGMRESDYMQVSDGLAWFREDLAVVKTALLKSQKEHDLLGLYRNFQYHVYSGNVSPRDRLNEKIQKLEKEIEEMK